MQVSENRLDKKDLAKYPFLKETKAFVSRMDVPLDSLIRAQSGVGVRIKENAARRVRDSLGFTDFGLQPDIESVDDEILSYAVARMIVSCLNDRMIMDRLARYEAERAYHFLQIEAPAKKAYVAHSFGLDVEAAEMGVVFYVGLVATMKDPKWRLVNRDVRHGMVWISPEEYDELLRERIRVVIRSQLPLEIPGPIAMRLRPYADDVSVAYQEKILEQYGDVDEGSYPPCMEAIIRAVAEGTNIPHTARFSLTAFLHTIGLQEPQIVEVFARAPDFDIGRTMYQVEHISGRGGTEYTPPGCQTMKTYGLCVNRDSVCKEISHPLSYYKRKKKGKKKEISESAGQ
jgi:DNA primase large subunit